MKRVVVTGIGVISALGDSIEEFEQAIRKGTSGIDKWDELEKLAYHCQVCARPKELTEEKLKNYFSDLYIRSIKHLGVLYGSIAGIDAWKDAGLEIGTETDWDSGAIMGIGSSSNDQVVKEFFEYTEAGNAKKTGSRLIDQSMNSGPSAHLTGHLGLGNQVTSNSSACSTGAESFIMCYDRIVSGKAKRMIAGGAEGYSAYGWAGFDTMRVLCRNSNDNPQRASRPMSKDSMGFVPGAGAGVLVLEDLDTALARGAKIYAEVLGGASNSGGQRNKGSMTRPNSEGVKRCIQDAIQSAGIQADDIDLISGHLTSTMADVLEVENWADVLGRSAEDFPYINSLKSMIGHSLGASGALELAAVALQLKNGFVHPSINSEELHPKVSERVAREKIPLQQVETNLKIVAKSSFAFGDVNSCVILKNWEAN